MCTIKQFLRNFRANTSYAKLSISQPSAFISSLYSYDLELERTLACKLVRICILMCTEPAGGRSGNEDPTSAMIIGPTSPRSDYNFVTFAFYAFILRTRFKKSLPRTARPPATVRINLHDRETCKTDSSRARMLRFLRVSISTTSSPLV